MGRHDVGRSPVANAMTNEMAPLVFPKYPGAGEALTQLTMVGLTMLTGKSGV